MPSARVNQTIYVGPFGGYEAINTPTLYKPGELGSRFEVTGKAYQLIQVDSGATALTAAGLPVAGHLAFWKDKSKYLVTNDRIQAFCGVTNSRNALAGVFCSLSGGVAGSASITPGNYGVIQQRGQHVGVLTSGSTVTAGLALMVSASATVPDALNSAINVAPLSPIVGIATAANGAVTATYTPATLGGWDTVDVP